MTPEERATEIVDHMVRARASINTNNVALRLVVENHIKVAENDVLERAAFKLEMMDEQRYAPDLAFDIRELKHKE